MASTLASPPRSGRIAPEINVTPLVDVVLVLLIIFMVIAPALEAGERVELPGIVNVDPKSKLDSFTLTVTASGRLLLEKEPIDPASLGRALRDARAAAPDKRLVLKADRGVKYGTMRRAFDEAQKVGFPGIALMVDEKQKGAR
ncbi:MAG TPA: biopolymer transporter ExbD [Haliangiales bacterium]|nr:biopolymer transporter ExbD [Haliangiales bacterium]